MERSIWINTTDFKNDIAFSLIPSSNAMFEKPYSDGSSYIQKDVGHCIDGGLEKSNSRMMLVTLSDAGGPVNWEGYSILECSKAGCTQP